MIGRRPIAAGIPIARRVRFTESAFEDDIPVDADFAGLTVNIRNVKFRDVEGKGRGPQKLAVCAIHGEQSSAFADGDDHVALFTFADIGIDPLHELRIGADARADQRPLVGVIEVPVIARDVLVIPRQLAGVDVKGNGKIAIEIRRRRAGNSIGIAVVAFDAMIGHRVRNAQYSIILTGS